MAVAKLARMRVYALPDKIAKLDIAGSSLGRLFATKAINYRMFEAGNRFAQAVWEYHELTGIAHPSPKAQDYRKIRGYGTGPDPKVDDVKTATKRYMAAIGSIMCIDLAGRPVFKTVMDVAVMDFPADNWPPHMVALIVRGLTALADHFGIMGDQLFTLEKRKGS